MKQLLLHTLGPPPQPVTPPPPPQGPIGATLGTAMNNFYSSPKKLSTHYIPWLFYFWILRRCLKFARFGPWGPSPWAPIGGHMYYMNDFETPAPKDDSCQVWLKSDHAFSRRRWNCYFLHVCRAPLPNLLPSTGAHCGHRGNCHEQLLFST